MGGRGSTMSRVPCDSTRFNLVGTTDPSRGVEGDSDVEGWGWWKITLSQGRDCEAAMAAGLGRQLDQMNVCKERKRLHVQRLHNSCWVGRGRILDSWCSLRSWEEGALSDNSKAVGARILQTLIEVYFPNVELHHKPGAELMIPSHS
eukprot:762494-Hanusia_phi.AAC.1